MFSPLKIVSYFPPLYRIASAWIQFPTKGGNEKAHKDNAINNNELAGKTI